MHQRKLCSSNTINKRHLPCVQLTTHESVQVAPDFYEPAPQALTAKMVAPQSDGISHNIVVQTDGGGDARARVTDKGVLGITSGKVEGKSVASADIFNRGGFAHDIDAVLQGSGALKSGGDGGVGRRGSAGIGFGSGYGSGFGGGAGGSMDDVIGGRLTAAAALPAEPEKQAEKKRETESIQTWKRSDLIAGGGVL